MNYFTLLQADPSGIFGGNTSFLIMMVAVFGVMYFFMIRPQQKKQKEQRVFRESLSKGDKVVTVGGIFGKVKEIKDNVVVVEIDDNVNVNFDKSCILPDYTDLSQQQK